MKDDTDAPVTMNGQEVGRAWVEDGQEIHLRVTDPAVVAQLDDGPWNLSIASTDDDVQPPVIQYNGQPLLLPDGYHDGVQLRLQTGLHGEEVMLLDRLQVLRHVHSKEQFGDCVEDGDPWPCNTIKVLDWVEGQEPLVLDRKSPL